MRGVNKVTLLGNCGGDPETKVAANTLKVSTFSLATTETYTDKGSGEKKQLTEWHNIVAWRGLAEICEKYIKKGAKLYIEGKIRSRSWDGEDGKKRYRTEIVADSIIILDKNSESNNQVDAPEVTETDGDDLPF